MAAGKHAAAAAAAAAENSCFIAHDSVATIAVSSDCRRRLMPVSPKKHDSTPAASCTCCRSVKMMGSTATKKDKLGTRNDTTSGAMHFFIYAAQQQRFIHDTRSNGTYTLLPEPSLLYAFSREGYIHISGEKQRVVQQQML